MRGRVYQCKLYFYANFLNRSTHWSFSHRRKTNRLLVVRAPNLVQICHGKCMHVICIRVVVPTGA